MLLSFVDWLIYSLLGLDPGAHHVQALHFFVYDVLKIFSLLTVLIFLIGVIRTYLPEKKLKDWMSRGGLFGNFVAATFGAITPFCSCSSIPLFIGFLKAGAPLGVTFSFLVTSPLINEYLVILMLGTFGWKITGLYVLLGMVMGITAGAVIGRLKLESQLEHDLVDPSGGTNQGEANLAFKDRLKYGWDEAYSILAKIWLWVLLGVGVGAIIHNYVPQESIHAVMEKTGILSVPIATFLGVPLYGSCAAIVPVAVVLFEKGIPLGTALAFMMAMAALSLPEAIMLRRVMKLSLIAVFFGVTTAAIIISGYVMNAVVGWL
ncbi:permease [Puniceicoccales bacterium CK1056]|uniref:Permease n=1 Tax=Oceanipulchritudo coccoides TaxID=2706888 RepID=A0A6B2M118_9BACT|nr:permease [Oceanipulchritudo coccoides]NDV62608.1 permease [Oceanipulchritudo coccoides]